MIEHEGAKFYTLEDLEPVLCIKKRTLYKYISNGRLKGVKIGKSWFVSETNLQAFLGTTQEPKKSVKP